MTSFCICNNSRMGAAIVAFLVTAEFTNSLASVPENKPEFDVQVNQAFGLRNSTEYTKPRFPAIIISSEIMIAGNLGLVYSPAVRFRLVLSWMVTVRSARAKPSCCGQYATGITLSILNTPGHNGRGIYLHNLTT